MNFVIASCLDLGWDLLYSRVTPPEGNTGQEGRSDMRREKIHHRSLKNIAVQLLYFFLCSLLCACEQAPVPEVSDANSGSRLNPYVLGEEITLHSKSMVHQVDYKLTFTSLWDSERVKQEYPNYSVSSRSLVRGKLSVDCGTTDSELLFTLTPYLLTEGGEKGAHFEMYQSGVLNNRLSKVRDGDEYEIIVLKNERSPDTELPALLKISYTNAEGQEDCVWVDLTAAEDTQDEAA